MNMSKWIIGLLIPAFLFSFLSCDDDEESDGYCTQATSIKIHKSTVTGPYVVPAGMVDLRPIRTITFAPPLGSEVLKIEVEGTGMFAVNSSTFTLQAVDPNLMPIGEASTNAGGNAPFGYKIVLWMPTSGASRAKWQPEYYGMWLNVTNTSGTPGTVNSVMFKIYTMEGVTIIQDSKQIVNVAG